MTELNTTKKSKTSNERRNEDLYEALLSGSEKEIVHAFKQIDALVDETLALVIKLFEGDKALINHCRYRLKIVPWSRRKAHNEFDNPSGHELIKTWYARLRKQPKIGGLQNGHTRRLDELESLFGMRHRKLNAILGPQKKKAN